MIIKTSIGKGFGGCVNYTMGKERAEVLQAEGVRMDSPKHMIDDFCFQKSAHPEVSKAVWHTSFSFNHADKPTPELMKQIADDYAKKFGFDQYAVIRHNDTKHEHFHFLGNRIKADGRVISDQYCASKGVDFSKKLEKQYNLTPTQSRNLEKANTQKMNPHDRTKLEVYKTVQNELKGCKNLEELQTKLKPHGIEVKPHSNSSGVFGVSFQKGNAAFKGSELGKDMSIKALNKTFSAALKKPIVKAVDIGKKLGRGMDM